jgi:hypothetical protein
MKGDLPAGPLLVKISQRLSSMMGWSHPHGHVVTITSNLEPAEQPTSTAKMLEVIRRLRDEQDVEPDERVQS